MDGLCNPIAKVSIRKLFFLFFFFFLPALVTVPDKGKTKKK